MKCKALQRFGIAIFGLSLSASALAAVTSNEAGGSPAGNDKRAAYDVPMVNWSAPQFFNPEAGVSSNMPGFASGGISAKAAFALPAFIPITPCRLVDTRGVFSPVYAGGAFAANEVRVYRAAGNCGVVSGNSRVKAVSLAVTTVPTPASGDIEVVSESATLGSTVVMVIQAGQWNSATTITAVDNEGDLKVQLRGTTGHVVIDINGYFASTNALNDDYISIIGSYTPGGGLLYVQNTSSTGAAINAQGTASSTLLALGPDAIVANGGLRVQGAGVNTDDFAYVHRVTAANSCVVGGIARTVLDHPDLNALPNSIAHVGQPIFAFPGATSGAEGEQGTFKVLYYLGAVTCGSTPMLNKWTVSRIGATPIDLNLAFPVIVIKP